MSKSKYSPEFRAMVAQEYLDGHGSLPYLAEKYKIGSTTLAEWVAKYRLHGIEAFITQLGNDSYSSEFKRMCVEEVLSGKGSVRDVFAKYNISSKKSERIRKDVRLDKQRFEAKYRAVKHFYETKNWSISWMCKQLEISRAAYYKWLRREIPAKEKEDLELAELIKEYDERFGHILGYRRMTAWINHFNQKAYSVKRIHRIVKILGIHAVIRKKKRKYAKSLPEISAENILKRDFTALFLTRSTQQ